MSNLIISNASYVSRPDAGETNSYDLEFDQLAFAINNHHLTPFKQCYSADLPNPVCLKTNDKVRIKIKIPKQIIGSHFAYDIDLPEDSDLQASLRLKSSEDVIDTDAVTITTSDYCGWMVVSIQYTLAEDITNLCSMGYGLCFEPKKLKLLAGPACENQQAERVKFDIETYAEFENTETPSV